MKTGRLAFLCLAMVVLAGCNMGIGADGGQPSVTIVSPDARSSVEVDAPLNVEVMAEDPDGPGVYRVDLQVDGMVVDTFEAAAPQDPLGVRMHCDAPSEPGASTLTAIAYRQDRTASVPATIALTVVEPGEEAAVETDPQPEEAATTEDEAREQTASASSEADVQARADDTLDVLDRPGEGCEVIGQVPRNTVIDLLRRTQGTANYWYQTDYLGEDELGWIANDGLTVLDDDGDLPRQTQATCQWCGDGTCNAVAGETCGNCATDCGACPASASQPQPPVAEGACAAGAGNCCGDGICQTDEGADWCGDCAAPASGPTCGDGACDEANGETCDNCPADCEPCGVTIPDLSFCGDGVCGDLETVESCSADCFPFNALLCLNASCGDGTCDTACGEDNCTCLSDCLDLWGDHFCISP